MAAVSHTHCKYLLLLCVLLHPGVELLQRVGRASILANAATTTLPLSAENIAKGLSVFQNLLDTAYDFRGKVGVPLEQVKSLGVPQQYIDAAEQARKDFRQKLADTFNSSASTVGDGHNIKELDSILNAEIPMTASAEGQPLVPALTALGKAMGDRVRASVTAASGAGQQLEGLTNTTAAGRKLLEIDEEEPPEGLNVVEAAEYDIKRIQKYLKHLAEIADEVFQAEEDAKAGGSSVSEAPEGPQRKLQQQDLIPSYLGNYATAFRFIFTNIFDFFRDFGLYGLTPIIADLRGFFTRYNWASDLLQIITAPVENFINTNYYPLPQSNDDVIALVRRFFADYCTYEEAASSKQVLGSWTGPTFTAELIPVSCPIYADPITGRNYISFADCDPAQLKITVTPLIITEPYLSAATYTGTECKYTEVYGVDENFAVGGGEQSFTFRRSAQGIDIVPTVVQLNSDLKFFNYQKEPLAPVQGGAVNITRDVTINQPAGGNITTNDATILTGTVPAGDYSSSDYNSDYSDK